MWKWQFHHVQNTRFWQNDVVRSEMLMSCKNTASEVWRKECENESWRLSERLQQGVLSFTHAGDCKNQLYDMCCHTLKIMPWKVCCWEVCWIRDEGDGNTFPPFFNLVVSVLIFMLRSPRLQSMLLFFVVLRRLSCSTSVWNWLRKV